MSWQLWVLIAAAATGFTALLAVKLSRAQEVFERLVEPAPQSPADLHAVRPEEPVQLHRRREPRPAMFPQSPISSAPAATTDRAHRAARRTQQRSRGHATSTACVADSGPWRRSR